MACSRLLLVIFFFILSLNSVLGINSAKPKKKREAPSSSPPPPTFLNEAMKFLFHANQAKLKYDEAPSSSSPPPFSSFNITNNENLPANLTNLPINFFEYDFVSIGTQMLTTFSNQGRNDNLFPKSDPKWTNKSWSTKPECGVSTITGEIRGCVDSKESMLKFVMPIMGTKVKGLTTPPGKLQLYRMMGPVRTIHNRVTTCHNKGDLSLLYAVYGCHYIPNSRVRVVPLLGADGTRLEALIVCHMDTSSWNPRGFVLRLLNRKPGPPVCHFMSTDDLLWVV